MLYIQNSRIYFTFDKVLSVNQKKKKGDEGGAKLLIQLKLNFVYCIIYWFDWFFYVKEFFFS